MIGILTHYILPVFAMLALGLLLGRARIVSDGEARSLNRISFLVLQPALIFSLIAKADLSEFEVGSLAAYAGSQVAIFAITLALIRLVFARPFREAWLLSMTTVFVNSLLYIWPISFLIYGERAALPVSAIVIWDTAFTFAFFILSMELMTPSGPSRKTAWRIAGNPVLLAIAIGALVNFAGISLSAPVENALDFAGPAAAPMTLFALGVILSATEFAPTPLLCLVVAIKLLCLPALVWAAARTVAPASDWSPLMVLTAAGPSGAMPFALALLYGIRTDVIAPVIVWTSVLSLFSLAWIA